MSERGDAPAGRGPLIVRERATYPQASAALNAAGLLRRSGQAWVPTTLRPCDAPP